MYVLFQIFSDDCTYSHDEFIGICETEDIAFEALKMKFRKKHPWVDITINFKELVEGLRDCNPSFSFFIREVSCLSAKEMLAVLNEKK